MAKQEWAKFDVDVVEKASYKRLPFI